MGKVWLATAAAAVTATLGAGEVLAQFPIYWVGDVSSTWRGAQVQGFGGLNPGQITNTNWSGSPTFNGDLYVGTSLSSFFSDLPTRQLIFTSSATTSPGNTAFPTSSNPNITTISGLAVETGLVSVVPDGGFSSRYPLFFAGAGPSIATGATLDLSHIHIFSNASVNGTFVVGPTWNTTSTPGNLTGSGTVRFARTASIVGGVNTSVPRTELTFNGPQWTRFNTQNSAAQVRFEPGGGTSSFSGGVTGTGAVVKGGTGTTTLYSALTHSGTTTIEQGTLRVSGSRVPAGYAAHYSFDVGSVVPGSFPNEVVGGSSPLIQFAGSSTQLVSGQSFRGNAVGLSAADDHLRIGSSGIPITSGQWTASAWVSGIQANTFNTLFRGSAGDHQLLTNNETLGLYTNGNNTFNSSGVFIGDERNTGWRQFTAVGRGNATDFYLDGVLVGSVPVTSTTDIYSVGNFFGGGQRFADLVDEVYVYQRSLSASEVYALYEGSLAGPTTTGALSGSSRVSISSGATLDLAGTTQTVAGLSGSGTLSLGGGTLTINSASGVAESFFGVINGPGTLVKSGPGLLSLAPTGFVGGWLSGSLVVNGGTLEIGSNVLLGLTSNNGVAVVMNGGGIRAGGAPRTITAPLVINGSFILGRLTNFTGTTTLNDSVTVTLGNLGEVANGFSTLSNIGQNGSPRTLTVSADAAGVGTGGLVIAGSGSYTGGTVINTRVRASGSALGGGGVTVNSAGELQITADTALAHLSGTGTVSAQGTAGTISTLTMGIDTAANGPDVFYGGVLADGTSRLGLTINQAPSRRVLFLNSPDRSTHSGPTLIRSGAFIATLAANALSPNSDLTVEAGGNLDLSGNSQSAGSLAGAGNVYSFVAASSPTTTLAVGGTNASTLFSGVIRTDAALQLRPVALVKNGTGTLTFTGSNTHTGGTTVNVGTLQLGNNTATGSVPGPIVVAANATLAVARSDSASFVNAVSGAGNFVKLQTSTLTIASTLSHTGSTTILAGGLRVGDGGSLSGSGPIVISAGTLEFARTGNVTLASNLSGIGSLSLRAPVVLTLAGGNSHSGGNIIDAGATLRLGSPAAWGNTFENPTQLFNGTLDLNGFPAVTSILNLGSSLPGAATRLITNTAGSGAVITLAGNLNSVGPSTGASSTAVITPELSLRAGNRTFASSGNLSAGAYDLVLAGPVTGAGQLIKNSNFRLVLAGAGSSFSGGLTVNQGSVTLGAVNAAGAGPVTLATGTTLTLNPNAAENGVVPGSYGQTVSNLIGSGSVLLGTARLTLTSASGAFLGSLSGTGGSLDVASPSTFALQGASSFTGGTILRGGTLRAQNVSALGSGPLTLVAGTLELGASSVNVTDVTVSYQASTTTNPTVDRTSNDQQLVVSGDFVAVGSPNAGRSARFVANVELTPGTHNVRSVGGASSSDAIDLLFAQTSGPGGLSLNSPSVRAQINLGGHTGATTINAGTLFLGAVNALSPSTPLAVAGGTLSLDPGGNGITTPSGFSQSLPQLSATSGRILLGNATLTTGGDADNTLAADIFGTFGLGPAINKQGTGTLTLAGSNSFLGAMAVNAGRVRLVGTHAPSTASYQIAPGALLELARPASATVPLETLSTGVIGLNGSAAQPAVARVTTVTATAAAGRTAAPLVTVLFSLDVASDGAPLGSRSYRGLLDLGTNDAVFLFGTVEQYRDLARAFLTSAASNGGVATQGLGSSSTIPHTRLAVFSNDASASGAFSNPGFVSYFSTFDGVAVNANHTLARFTYIGDTDLDGTLTGNDFVNLIEGLSNNYTGWQHGDFDYNGVVDAADVSAFSAAFAVRGTLPSLGSPADATPGGGGAGGVIPEPSALSLLAVPALVLTRRRRA